MEFYELFGFVMILSKSIKLLPKNGKLMVFIVAFSFVLSSSLLLLFNYSLKSLVIDMFVKFRRSSMPNPSSYTPKLGFDRARIIYLLGHMREELALILTVEIAYFHAISIISFFSSLATILVSSMSYSAKTISLKDLFSRIGKTSIGPMLTTFYVSFLGTGYHVFIVMLVVPIMMYPNTANFCVAILLGIVAIVVDLYLVVSWRLAIVVSVIEERCHGMEALGKAERLAKGKRLHGFLLNICFTLLVLIIFVVYKMLLGRKWFVNPALSPLFLVNVFFLLKILVVVAYTVLYFQCKKHHGEEIELHLRYTKLPTTQMIYPK